MSGFLNSLKFFIAAAYVIWCSCSAQHLTGGTSTSENARVKGRIVDQNGAAVGGARVLLLPVDYDPVKDSDAVAADTTDASGDYVFTKIIAGVYSIQALDMGKKRGAIVRGIQVSDRFDTLAADTVRPAGFVKIEMPANGNLENGYMYIPGTTFFAFLKSNSGFVTLDSVPGGKSLDVYYSSTNSPAATIFRYGVRVNSGDTAVVWNFGWNYSRTITLNTSASGAHVSGSVVNFPVLIRMDGTTLDFTQARNNGEDIRFTKSDNTFLPYEIERWDAMNKRAEVWVNVDTVRGNGNTQSITMYWGNIDASAQSNSAAVFDTAAGFAGVWHLGQPAGALVADATANGIDGAATATATVSGAIGAAQAFNGTSSLIRTSGPNMDKLNFSDSAEYSVCAWVKTNVLDSIFHGVVYKSNVQYGLQMRPQNKWEFVTYIDKSRWEMSRAPVVDNAWHCIAGVRSGAKQYLYVDGVLADSSIAVLESGISRAYDQPLEIGHCPDGGTNPDRYFSGSIDEVRISRVAYGADWIKLCFMNQKEQDALVKW